LFHNFLERRIKINLTKSVKEKKFNDCTAEEALEIVPWLPRCLFKDAVVGIGEEIPMCKENKNGEGCGRQGTLKFNLDDPYEKDCFVRATLADNMWWAILEFDERLRRYVKYADLSDETYKIYEGLRNELRDCMFNVGVPWEGEG